MIRTFDAKVSSTITIKLSRDGVGEGKDSGEERRRQKDSEGLKRQVETRRRRIT